ncbi:hypothetical protein PsorP6_010191 [Peronosclerospora sorghi]|uniref:Uncharacterized protein n=1 Tax=Peronosclerospora sorghi TaxID=230839 RepID=A0ACC0VTT8_9STRA|nr:hypothetical protein PsorP6_010191 [Peronosclerospora sorghi]
MTDPWCLYNEGDADLTLCGCCSSRDDQAELAAALLVVTGRQLLHGTALLRLLEAHMAARERYYLTSSVLPLPFELAWAQLYRHGTDAHFIHMMGIPSSDYWRLLCLTTQSAAARAARDDQRDLPVIARRWRSPLSSTRATATPSTCARPLAALPRRSCMLRRAEEALEVALSTLTDDEIRCSTEREQLRWASWIAEREPIVQRKFGFINGKNFRVQEPSCAHTQNALYNGWLHYVLVTGTIAFGGDGCIIWMKHNCSGSWNDGDTSQEFREKLLDPTSTLQHLGVLADAAFPVTGSMFGRIVTPLKDGDLLRSVAQGTNEAEVKRVKSAITSIRQAAEWGIGVVDRVFRRLHGLLPFEPVVRRRRLANIHHLYNLRVRDRLKIESTSPHKYFGTTMGCRFTHDPATSIGEDASKALMKKIDIHCRNFNTLEGCKYGDECFFIYDAAKETEEPVEDTETTQSATEYLINDKIRNAQVKSRIMSSFAVSSNCGATEDDGKNCITRGNFAKFIASPFGDGKRVEEISSRLSVACITTDFSMQKVMLQIGLSLLSAEGMIIKRVKQ